MDTYHKASLVLRKSGYYGVNFRHPILKNSRGQGLRVSRSLKTTDKSTAKDIVADINSILHTPKYWSLSSLKEAQNLFCDTSVHIFYDYMILLYKQNREENTLCLQK